MPMCQFQGLLRYGGPNMRFPNPVPLCWIQRKSSPHFIQSEQTAGVSWKAQRLFLCMILIFLLGWIPHLSCNTVVIKGLQSNPTKNQRMPPSQKEDGFWGSTLSRPPISPQTSALNNSTAADSSGKHRSCFIYSFKTGFHWEEPFCTAEHEQTGVLF